MANKNDLLKRERDDQRKLADYWKLQHDEYKKLNAKLAARVKELEGALEGVLPLAESYLNTMLDRHGIHTPKLEAARAALTKEKSHD